MNEFSAKLKLSTKCQQIRNIPMLESNRQRVILAWLPSVIHAYFSKQSRQGPCRSSCRSIDFEADETSLCGGTCSPSEDLWFKRGEAKNVSTYSLNLSNYVDPKLRVVFQSR